MARGGNGMDAGIWGIRQGKAAGWCMTFYESFGYLEGTIQLAHERCALGDATKRGSDDALRAIRAEHEFMERLLRVIEAAENNEDLLWREQSDGSWKFFVICNDVFWWATADLEEINPDNI